MWLGLTDSLPKGRVRNEKNSNFTEGKPGKHYLYHMAEVNITNIVTCISHVLYMK